MMSSLAWLGVVCDGRMLESGSRPVEWDAGRCSASYRRLAITGLVPVITRLLANRYGRRTSAGRGTNCGSVAVAISNVPSAFRF